VGGARFDLHESHTWLMGMANGRMVRKFDTELHRWMMDKPMLIEVTNRFAPRCGLLDTHLNFSVCLRTDL
jgi:hypothetical protein